MSASADNPVEAQDLRAWLRLHTTPGIGSVHGRRLLKAFGWPAAIFAQDLSALCAVVPLRQAQGLSEVPQSLDTDWERLLAWLQAAPDLHRTITLADSNYPAALLEIEDPPLMLFAQGRAAAWNALPSRQTIALVGSRNPTPQGAANARAFAHALAQAGLTVVSGLAHGVDAAAHTGALEVDGTDLATIAVVGTGLDRVYPAHHADLAAAIASRGLVLSEYPLGSAPLPAHFPRRNRLIAGLSAGTLVIEAALQSGSLITAQQALEQGKEVFALPGSIHSTQAKGCNALIKQGAQLVDCVEDILKVPCFAAQQSLPLGESPAKTRPSPAISTGGGPLLDALGFDPASLEVLQIRTGWDAGQLQALLMELELSGDVARLPGGLFQRLTN